MTVLKFAALWIGCSFLAAFLWGLVGVRRQLQRLDDDPVLFEDPDDRAVRERAINETLAVIDQWGPRDSAWLHHPANGLTDQQIRRIYDQIHADIWRVERGEPVE